MDGGIGSLVHQGLLQEALLDGRVGRQLVEQLQGGGGHAQKARPCAALLLIEGFLGSAFPAGKKEKIFRGGSNRAWMNAHTALLVVGSQLGSAGRGSTCHLSFKWCS